MSALAIPLGVRMVNDDHGAVQFSADASRIRECGRRVLRGVFVGAGGGGGIGVDNYDL